MEYTERWGFPDISSALSTMIGFVMFGPYIALPLLRTFARSAGVLPKPDAGAKAVTLDSCVKGSVNMLVQATGRTTAGEIVTKQLQFAGVGDAGVGHTSVCHGEIAVLLAKRTPGPNALCGVGLTPISALGKDLPDALVKTGLIFIEDVPKALVR